MDLSILEVLYIVLIFFTCVIGTLLSIILYKLLRIIDTLSEIVDIYNTVKQILGLYSQIPELIFGFVKDFLLGKRKK